MPRSSLLMGMQDTPPVQHCPWPQLGDGRTPLLGKRMCLRPVAFQGCREASGHGVGGGEGQAGGGDTSGQWEECQGLPPLEELKLSRH